MQRFTLSWLRNILVLTVVVIALTMSLVNPASAAPGDQSFNYTITAKGTETVAVYPGQSFQWTVTTTGTETWAEHNVLLGEWTIEQWGFGENIVKTWPAPVNSVIESWSYQREDLGWQVAQGWDTGTSIDAGNNQLNIKFFTGGTILWKGGYRATYRIYGTRYHYDPLSYTQSGSGIVQANEGNKFISNFNLGAPPPQHGGTVAVNTRTITDTSDRVTTNIDQTAGKVYASTSYSVTMSVNWLRQQTGNATVNATEGNKLTTISTLVAPNGDTTWSVTDNNANVDTWMDGNKLYARALSAADKPFNYTVQGSGTQTTTTYPDQSFNWTVTTTGTETWVQSDILLNEVEILVWDYAQTHIYYLDAPANSVVTRWSYDQHDLGAGYAQGWDGGSYLNGNQLVINAYTGGANVWPFIWTGGYWATYRIYGNQYHYDPVSYTQSGSGVVNKTEGNKSIANFSLAAPIAQHGGTVSNVSRTITDNNANVTISMDQTAGKVYASTSYSVSNTQPWSNWQTGSSAVSYLEGDKYITTSTLVAPNGDTTWSVTDNKTNVNTWMVGNNLYARALNLQAPVARDDPNLTTAEETPLLVAAPGVLGNDYDPEGDSITAQIASGPAHGSLTLNADGSFQYIPNLNYNGTDSFTYIARDISLQSTQATVSIVVVSVNDLPTISNITDRTISEDGNTGAIPFTIGDVETTANSLTLSATTSNPTLVPNANIIFGGSGVNRTVTVTPAPNENGTTTITVSVTDADGGTVSDNFILTVTAVNDPPVISNIANQTTNEDTPTAAINFIVGDPETPASSLTLLATSSNSTLVPNGNIVFGGSGGNRMVTITPAANLSGTATITVTVSDGTASSNNSFILTVNTVNDLPIISNIANQTINEDEASGTISFTVSDQETPAGSLVISASSSNPTLVPTGSLVLGGSGGNRTIKITPAPNQNGTSVIAVWVEDADVGRVYTNFVLTVNAVNDVPLAVNDAYSTNEDTVLNVAAPGVLGDDTDVEGTALIAVLAVGPAKGTLTLNNNGSFTYTPNANVNGTDSFTYKASDGQASSNVAIVTIMVNPVNDAPVAVNDTYSTNEDTVLNVAAPGVLSNDTDVEGTALTAVLAVGPIKGTLTLNSNGSFTYTPNANVNGTDSFTYKASDGQANSNVATVTITINPVNDIPVAECKGTILDLDAQGRATLSPSAIDDNSYDVDGDPISLTVSKSSFDCSNVGQNSVTLTVRDDNGASSSCTTIVTVQDKVPPVAMVKNITVQLSAIGNVSITAGDVDNGSSDACGIASMTVSPNAFSFANVGANTVTLTVIDKNGNISTATTTVTVVDMTAPVVTAPADVTKEATGPQTAVVIGTATATDAVGVVSITNNAPATYPVGVTPVTWTAEDAAGNAGTATQNVTVMDTTAPVVTPPADVNKEATGPQTQVAIGTATAIDAVGVVGIASDAPAVFPLGATVVTWTAKDASGNFSTATQTVTVIDSTAPVLTLPANVTIEQATAAGTVVPLTATATDICDANVAIDSDAKDIYPLGTTTVTFTATDDSGNSTSGSMTVTVVDTTKPTLVAPADVTVEQISRDGTPANIGQPTVSDICDANPVVTNNAPSVFPLGNTTVTFTATDDSGNSTSGSMTVMVIDTTKPVLTLPANVTIEQATAAGTVVPLTATATDICDANVAIDSDAKDIYPLGNTTVTFTATDDSGNSTSGSMTVTVVDTTKPTLVAPAVVTVEQISRDGTPANIGQPTVSDICDANPVVTNNAPSVFPLGLTTVTWTATDVSGNKATAEQKVTVIDTTQPILTVPGNVTVEQTTAAGTVVPLTATATDICDANVAIDSDAKDIYPLGTTTVTFTATDDSGNSTSGSMTVMVVDTTKPTLVAPADVTVEQISRDGTPANIGQPTVSDICDANPVVTNNAPSVFPLGLNTVTWTATDVSGNIATATQTVTVTDKTAPVIIVPANISVEQTSKDGTPVAIGMATATDICDAAPVVTNNAPSVFPLGVNTVTWTATDASGNKAMSSQTVTVIDTTKPVLTVPANVTVEQATAAGTVVPLNATANDICDADVTITSDAKAIYPLGNTTVTFTATDDSGNSTSGSMTVMVIDTTKPVLTLPANVTIEQATAAGTVVPLTATATDICDANVAIDSDAKDIYPLGTTTVTFTATDDSGNFITKSVKVTVTDTTVPVLTVPANISVEQTSKDGTPVTIGIATATDICDAAPVITNNNAPASGLFPLGATTVTWTAKDASGNIATATQTVTVTDKTAPVITVPANISVEQTSKDGTPVAIGMATATDICDAAPVVTNSAPAVFPLGTTTVTWTAKDASGNMTTATQNITVKDTTAPVLTIPGSVTAEQATASGTVVPLTASATDICDADVAITSDAKDIYPLGTTTVTFTATDDSGNSTSGSMTVTVVDTTAPVVTVSLEQVAPYYTTQTVGVNYMVNDICDAAPVVRVTLSNNGGAPVVITAASPISLNLAALAGQNVITVTATDASGNVGTASASFEVILQLVGEQQIVIKPESLNVNQGEFTAFIVMPAPYDAINITDAIADGAPSQNINYASGEQKAIIKFDRASITVLPVDVHFEVTGHFLYNGASCRFVGSDDITKVDTDEVPANKKK